jgi:hypothetical protein
MMNGNKNLLFKTLRVNCREYTNTVFSSRTL